MRCPTLIEVPPPAVGRTGWPWTEEAPPLPDAMPDGSPWPKITIVTPSYNQGQFIEETIRSVLLQGYPNLEYMVIDGGSTDASVEIIRGYAVWLAYWISEKDRGQSHAINKGWARATGDLLGWLNSDDLLNPGCLVSVARAWSRDKTVGLVHGRTEWIDEHSQMTGRTHGAALELTATLVSSRNTVAQPSAFVSKRALQSVGLLDERFHISMDWDLWLRLASRFPSTFIGDAWSKSRVWGGAKTFTSMELLSGQEHVASVRKLFSSPSPPRTGLTVRRKAFAAAYGLKAKKEYRSGRLPAFWAAMALSLFYYPPFRGADARPLLWECILGKRLVGMLCQIKRSIHRPRGANLRA